MPSSISSSSPGVRLTAADRPGVAQPVPVRDIPVRPWRGIMFMAATIALLLVGAWEWHWRTFGVFAPDYNNSNGEWAIQRRRVDSGDGHQTVIVGSSRLLFDLQLPVWERLTGTRPIQLAMEGTSPMFALEDLAKDPHFGGRLLVGVDPDLFFTGRENREGLAKFARDETPSQRSGEWLSRTLLEPYLAFYDSDYALPTVLKRQPWPPRDGVRSMVSVRKLLVQDADRGTAMWSKVEHDPAYNALARRIWTQFFHLPPRGIGADSPKMVADRQIGRAVQAVATMRARGVEVVFIRSPSTGPFLEYENRTYPRAATWDALLARTGARGIHFEDHPQLQGYTLPEWSHLSRSEARRFTAALVPLVDGVQVPAAP